MPTPEFKEDFTSAHAQKAPRGSKRERVHNKCGHTPTGEMGSILAQKCTCTLGRVLGPESEERNKITSQT